VLGRARRCQECVERELRDEPKNGNLMVNEISFLPHRLPGLQVNDLLAPRKHRARGAGPDGPDDADASVEGA
jgi:hypothetical protein